MAIQVILLERIEKLGQMGDVVSVKPGFARNFLLPQRKALRASKHNLEYFETQRAQLVANNLERKNEAEQVAAKLKGLMVPVVRAAGDTGQLYGSVTARDIADAVTEAGFTVGRGQIVLDRAIKALGLEEIRVALHPEVSVSITVNVARSLDEAEQQARLGRAVGTEPGAMEDDLDDLNEEPDSEVEETRVEAGAEDEQA